MRKRQQHQDHEDDGTYEKIAPKAVEEVLLMALNHSIALDKSADWPQIATACAIAKLAIAVEESNQQE
jgi:hypothetical protein